jgi:hypothetical protein
LAKKSLKISVDGINLMFRNTNFRLAIANLIRSWILRHASQDTIIWLDDTRKSIKDGTNKQLFFSAFSRVPRHTGKSHLTLMSDDLAAAFALCGDWSPQNWHVDQASRTLLLLDLPQDNAQNYLGVIEQVYSMADMGELIALYQALPLLAYPESLKKLAVEGVRNNITEVFNAVALHNPYPAEYFDELAWNQMVIKALFVGSSLPLIQGLHTRMNSQLAHMLFAYSSERQAAARTVPPEVRSLMDWWAASDCKRN